ncbi:unnamed protein product [Paramecium primaurelia]|uniref:Uncharacterized protein n=1 Tax=Paramecium primaurelia TaxID=5886 RepID=A0A8S1QTR4_PARPR|nr:unnamed protein product [Paramecium primaurelia]
MVPFVYGIFKQEDKMQYQIIIAIMFDQFVSLLMVLQQLYLCMGCQDRTIQIKIEWSLKRCEIYLFFSQQMGYLEQNQMLIITLLYQYAFLLMVLNQHLVEIVPSVNGMLRHKKYYLEFFGHSSWINSISFTPDGCTLASGCSDGSIGIWNMQKCQLKSMLYDHSGWVTSVCFSSDGLIFASGSFDQSIHLWDVKTALQQSKLDGHSRSVLQVSFSPDRKIFASCSEDKSVCLWDAKTGRQKSILNGHRDYVLSVCFSPEGQTLASCSDDKSILQWYDQTGQQIAKLNGHDLCVNSVCFSPDGTTLASGCGNPYNGGNFSIPKLDCHDSCVNSVCISPDGTLLASCNGILHSCKDCSIRLWDFKTGYQILDSDKNLKDILAQLKLPHQANSLFHNTTTPITILLISQKLIFQAEGALIFNEQFTNQQGIDLGLFLKQKGCYLLEGQINFQKSKCDYNPEKPYMLNCNYFSYIKVLGSGFFYFISSFLFFKF